MNSPKTELNSAGDGLLFSTFLGSNAEDNGPDLAVSAAGDTLAVTG